MRWQLFTLTAGMLAGAMTLPRGLRAVPPTGPEPLARRLEVARPPRAHFDSVGAELLHANVLRFTPAQRRVRATLIDWLQEYRDAGAFPRNDRFPERSMPFFRDRYGALCAMAYLIDRSGRRDLVDRVAATRSNAFIDELADDPDLRAWLDSVGLSVTEAARIQPTYPELADVVAEVRQGLEQPGHCRGQPPSGARVSVLHVSRWGEHPGRNLSHVERSRLSSGARKAVRGHGVAEWPGGSGEQPVGRLRNLSRPSLQRRPTLRPDMVADRLGSGSS